MTGIKIRKCPECGEKMTVRRSSKGGRFWGCNGYPDCKTTLEYFNGARVGLNLEIKQIDNGYLISSSQKFAERPEDEDQRIIYVKDLENVSISLHDLLSDQSEVLIERLAVDYGFVDETPKEKKLERANRAQQSTKDVKKLLQQVKEARALKD